MEFAITIETIHKLTGIRIDRLKVYLHGYRFNKFIVYKKIGYRGRAKELYLFNDEFINTFCEYLIIIRKRRQADLFLEGIKNDRIKMELINIRVL